MAKDNPIVGSAAHLPEIYSFSHRVIEGMDFHTTTGALWASEHGPMGGDEVNIIRPGGNYGWPLLTYGIDYDGKHASQRLWREDLVEAKIFWVPSIAPSGTMFYTGNGFPQWKDNLFVGALQVGRIPGTGHVQRKRDVKQGPDGLLYVLTEGPEAALPKVEPAGG